MRRASFVGILAAGALWAQAPPPADEKPKELGLSERAHRNLAQFEVALTGPRERLAALKPAEFDITVAGKSVTPVAIDSLCPASVPSAIAGERGEPLPVPVPTAPASYLFYFDQRNLTMGGHQTSLDVAGRLIRKLIRNGHRGSVVSSGRRLVTFAPFTDRTEPLLDALERVRNDPGQWDEYASLEDKRQEEISRARYPDSRCALARVYQREEFARARQTLELFSAALGRFNGIDAPKVAIYFSDTLRDQPGRHYVVPQGRRCELSVHDTILSFRQVHDAAAAYDVKVYGVEAEGIQPASRGLALRDSQGGLKALALETGGDAFLNGAGVDHIVGKIEADMACVYLVSFDPAPFPTDKPLGLEVRVGVPGVRARTRTHLVIQSESAHRTAMLLAAFTAPDDVKDGVAIHGGIVPLDVEDGRLRFLAQAILPATELRQGETWDMGMSLVSRGDVPREASGRITVDRGGVTILLESDMEAEPGPFEIALAAVEAVTGKVGAGRLSESWTGKVGPSGIVAISVLQPTDGVFWRDGVARKNGSVVVAPGQPVRAALPTAFVTLVCRVEKKQRRARVHRAVACADVTYPPLELSFEDKACVQVRDVVPPGTLPAGACSYDVAVDGAPSGERRAFEVK